MGKIDIETIDIETIAALADNEGLNYTIMEKVKAEEIEDEELAKLWKQASEKLKEADKITDKIQKILDEYLWW